MNNEYDYLGIALLMLPITLIGIGFIVIWIMSYFVEDKKQYDIKDILTKDISKIKILLTDKS